MAHTPQGQELTEAHRKAQVALTAYVVAQTRAAFQSEMDADDITGSFGRVVRKLLPVIVRARSRSVKESAEYLERFRQREIRGVLHRRRLRPPRGDELSVPPQQLREVLVEPEPIPDVQFDLPDETAIVEQLYVTGPGAAKKRIKDGKSPAEALRVAETQVATVAARLTGDGGRAVIEDEVRQGRNGAIGYCRVPDADPCPFCAMLASRGPVYRSDAFTYSNSIFAGDGRFKVHNGCDCTLEPVYGRRATDLPPGVAKLSKEWAEVAAGRDDPFGYWRRWRESGTKPGEEAPQAKVVEDTTSAPQKGREKKRGDWPIPRGGKKALRKKYTRDELKEMIRQQQARRDGLVAELEELQRRGLSVDEPGPAKYIASRLETVRNSMDVLLEALV